MTKQCGTCRFLDRENKVMLLVNAEADCLAPVPDSVNNHEKLKVQEIEGRFCPTYLAINTVNERRKG